MLVYTLYVPKYMKYTSYFVINSSRTLKEILTNQDTDGQILRTYITDDNEYKFYCTALILLSLFLFYLWFGYLYFWSSSLSVQEIACLSA